MKLTHRPQAVIFDMDGLIFDTGKLYQEAIIAAADEVGQPMTVAVFQSMIGRPWLRTRQFLVEHYGPSFAVDDFRAAWNRHFDVIVETRLSLKPGVVELLDVLDQLALPRAIATSSAHHTVQHHLAAHKLTDRFRHVVAHGDYTEGKPAHDPYLKAARMLDVDPSFCLALEDSHNGVRSAAAAAAAAGMMTVMVPDLIEATDEIRELCALVLLDLHAVRRLVSR
ncbi:MAG: family hydrolase [Reyranella sp.]|nr:family hydrolase [Reyranella sp.]